jgi:hypothetical protein
MARYALINLVPNTPPTKARVKPMAIRAAA